MFSNAGVQQQQQQQQQQLQQQKNNNNVPVITGALGTIKKR
jgi:preprotein translocase subunit YajC